MRSASGSEETGLHNPLIAMHITQEYLDQARMHMDAPADHLIEQIVQRYGKDQVRQIFDLLIRNIELPLDQLPEEIEAFVRQYEVEPDWVDPSQLETAEAVFLDHGPKFLVYLYFKSLPTLYACANGAQVLVQTGRLTQSDGEMAIFTRRIAETGQFLLDVMSPGGLHKKGRGVQAALKVRLIHASIRYFLLDTDWDTEQLGKPINQEDMALTLMTFSISMIQGMEQSHLSLSDDEADSYLHAWKLVGHYLGVAPDLIPASVKEGRHLMETILNRQARASDAGQLLTAALVRYSEGTFKRAMWTNIPNILIRHLNDRALVLILDVQSRWGLLYLLLPPFLRRWVGWIERIEDLAKPISQVMDRVSQRLVRKMVDHFDGYQPRAFRLDEAVKLHWGLGKEEV